MRWTSSKDNWSTLVILLHDSHNPSQIATETNVTLNVNKAVSYTIRPGLYFNLIL